MAKLSSIDIQRLETSPTSSASLRSKLGVVINNSTRCRAKVDTFNPETGQYRIVLQGTFEQEETWDED